jgi:hypothetical protein
MSTQNPYEIPEVRSNVSASEDRERLRRIAAGQRSTNLAALSYICLLPANFLIRAVADSIPGPEVIFAVLVISVLVYGAVSVYGLASEFRGKVIAVIYVIGLLVPFLGLLLLMSLSGKATKILRENGIRVGFLGADPNSV